MGQKLSAARKLKEKYAKFAKIREAAGSNKRKTRAGAGPNDINIASGTRTAGANVVADDVVEKTGLIVDVLSTPKTPGIPSDTSANMAKVVEKMDVGETTEKKPPVASSSESMCAAPPSTGGSTEGRKLLGVSTPKPTGILSEAVKSKPKTGEKDEENDKYFVQVDGRRKNISEEESSHYRNVAKDNERKNQKLCAAQELLLSFITCSMAH